MKRFKPIFLSASDIVRFWSHVEKTETCWLWRGALNQKGYGTFMIGDGRHSVHRISWTLHNGPIPFGKLVCHKCDVSNCVKPDDLFTGTNSDNMKDAAAKGRLLCQKRSDLYRGENSKRSKLKEDDVREIRKLAGTVSRQEIAKKFGMSKGGLSHIIAGRVWQHVV